MASSKLDVPGARLYHEVYGTPSSGLPLLLCISGADGSCEIWRDFAEALKEHFMVVLWDRRGFSRSPITDTQHYAHRLDRDVEDAAALIAKYSTNSTPTAVIGNSSGAIISLQLLAKHAKDISTLLCYEPPAARLLPKEEFRDIWTKHEEVYATYRASGPFPALEKFAELTGTDQRMVRALMDFEKSPYLFSNLQYWFEREFLVYPQARIDEETLERAKEKLVLVIGALSPKGAYQVRGNLELGKRLGVEVEVFPGEHVGHATHAVEFAAEVRRVLEKRAEA